MGDTLEEAPEKRLRKGSTVPFPTAASRLWADVLALDTVDEDGLQGRAEEVSIGIITGDYRVWRYISFLQGLERLRQLLFDLRNNTWKRKKILIKHIPQLVLMGSSCQTRKKFLFNHIRRKHLQASTGTFFCISFHSVMTNKQSEISCDVMTLNLYITSCHMSPTVSWWGKNNKHIRPTLY